MLEDSEDVCGDFGLQVDWLSGLLEAEKANKGLLQIERGLMKEL